jgi:hypothetical protein
MYQMSMSAEMIEKTRPNTHLGEMIGAWGGRHVEEAAATEANSTAVKASHAMWERDRKAGLVKEYVNIADPSQTNQIQKDAWNMVPRESKKEIEKLFGKKVFMVRKDVIDSLIGYRGFSIGEAWTGPSRMHPMMKKVIRDLSEFFLGKYAYRTLVTAEKLIQQGVGGAKNIILVLSIVVPIANAASNVGQLMLLGVPFRDIINGFKTKLVEVEKMQKFQKRQVEIIALKAVHAGDTAKIAKLDAEYKSINDAVNRMSIGPMIQTGEFTSILEGETEVDAAAYPVGYSFYFR